MGNLNCPKCGGEMDEGRIRPLHYLSNRQTGITIGETTPIDRAQVCLTCGYMEIYMKVERLKKKLQK